MLQQNYSISSQLKRQITNQADALRQSYVIEMGVQLKYVHY